MTRLTALVAALTTLLCSAELRAKPEFPGLIADHLGMTCPPPCNICHASATGGGPLEGEFFEQLFMANIAGSAPETVAPAIDAVRNSMSDSDGDGTADIAELEVNRNPTINPSTSGTSDAIICGPTYGCGARVAPRAPRGGSALAFALVVAGYLALRSRRSA